jgi:hypothetical protein
MLTGCHDTAFVCTLHLLRILRGATLPGNVNFEHTNLSAWHRKILTSDNEANGWVVTL